MAEPRRVQRSRAKGWKMPPNTVYVGRPTKWGNPFTENSWGRDLAIALFRDACNDVFDPGTLPVEFEDWLFVDASQTATYWRRNLNNGFGTPDTIRRELRGKDLACWCKVGEPCHADVLIEIANDGATPLHGESDISGDRAAVAQEKEIK